MYTTKHNCLKKTITKKNSLIADMVLSCHGDEVFVYEMFTSEAVVPITMLLRNYQYSVVTLNNVNNKSHLQ